IPDRASRWASGAPLSCSPRTLSISSSIMLRFLHLVIETAQFCFPRREFRIHIPAIILNVHGFTPLFEVVSL
ncbi:MAG: hypothetical protein WCZ86_06885, partial [Desulfurivibrionaceae bacterium]